MVNNRERLLNFVNGWARKYSSKFITVRVINILRTDSETSEGFMVFRVLKKINRGNMPV